MVAMSNQEEPPMPTDYRYIQVHPEEVPSSIRWDTPRENQGQIVQVSYGEPNVADEAGPGARWKRVIDYHMPVGRQVTYYRKFFRTEDDLLADAQEAREGRW